MKLLIAIVNYRSANLTIDCLQSLSSEMPKFLDARVVVVDCASADGSLQTLAGAIDHHGWNSWAQLIAAPENGGFAYGNNLAIKPFLDAPGSPEYVLLLNPDTLVRPGALTALVNFMDQNPRVGIAGSRLEDPDGTQQRSAFRFPSIFGELDNGLRLGLVSRMLHRFVVAPAPQECPHETDWVAGASMIVRRQVISDIGLMDEQYFLYYEEVDYCLRARRAGWQIWYAPESRVVHLIGQSTGVTTKTAPTQRPRRRPAYWFDSRKRYFVKNRGHLYAMIADAAWLIGLILCRTRQIVQRRPNDIPISLIPDLFRHSLLKWKV